MPPTKQTHPRQATAPRPTASTPAALGKAGASPPQAQRDASPQNPPPHPHPDENPQTTRPTQSTETPQPPESIQRTSEQHTVATSTSLSHLHLTDSVKRTGGPALQLSRDQPARSQIALPPQHFGANRAAFTIPPGLIERHPHSRERHQRTPEEVCLFVPPTPPEVCPIASSVSGPAPTKCLSHVLEVCPIASRTPQKRTTRRSPSNGHPRTPEEVCLFVPPEAHSCAPSEEACPIACGGSAPHVRPRGLSNCLQRVPKLPPYPSTTAPPFPCHPSPCHFPLPNICAPEAVRQHSRRGLSNCLPTATPKSPVHSSPAPVFSKRHQMSVQSSPARGMHRAQTPGPGGHFAFHGGAL